MCGYRTGSAHMSTEVRRGRLTAPLLTCVFLLAGCGSTQSASASSSVAVPVVSLEKVPGNIANPTDARVVVQDGIASSQQQRGGVWVTLTQSPLTAAQRDQLAADTGAPANVPFTMTGACHGPPFGDVGGWLLGIGSRSTNCPPDTAAPLLRLLQPYVDVVYTLAGGTH